MQHPTVITTSPARGVWQRAVWTELTAEGSMPHPVNALVGRAARYAPRYQRSLANLLRRAGVQVRVAYSGQHGRKWIFLAGMAADDTGRIGVWDGHGFADLIVAPYTGD